jgi:putative FmdB family regulatory protein
MPMFEYRCQGCGYTFEKFSPSGCGSSGPECPKCKEGSTEKIFSTFASQFGSAPAASGGGCGGSSGFS